IIGLGIEKVALSASLIDKPDLIEQAAARVGSQSIVAVIDVKKTGMLKRYEVVTHNATRRTGEEPVQFARRVTDSGAGEIVINSVDRDGTMEGYDLPLVSKIREVTNLPVTVLGGA